MALRQLRCSVRSSTAAAVKGARPFSLRSAQLVRPAALHAATPALSARAAAAQAFSTLAARRTPSVSALATDMARLSRFAAAHGLRIASVRTFSAEAAGKGAAGSAGSEAEAARAAAEAEAEAARAQAEAEAEAAYFEAEEPFVAKLSRCTSDFRPALVDRAWARGREVQPSSGGCVHVRVTVRCCTRVRSRACVQGCGQPLKCRSALA
ncbi:hypothetical protein EON68_01655 [archaeon]|nr:MAG: hypothetical protein EON68_01655 [archaeon]